MIAFSVTMALSVFSISLMGYIYGWIFEFETRRIVIGIVRQLILVAIACGIVIVVNKGVSRLIGPDDVDPAT